MHYDVNLNIHYSAPQHVWDKIEVVFSSMPYWAEDDNCPCWQGANIDLDASCEPGGLNICGEMPDDIWREWFETLKKNLSAALGYEIGEIEDGFQFKFWEPFRKKNIEIMSIDSEKIVFRDLSTFYWHQFSTAERDITAKPPYFRFSSDLIELYVTFESSGILSERKAEQSFHFFMKQLDRAGVKTRDLS